MRLPLTCAELGQRQQSFAVERRRGNAHVGDADRGERRRGAGTGRERRNVRAASAGAGTPYSAALAETKIATS